MIRTKIVLFFLLVTTLFGARVEELFWEKGETFLVFLEKNNIPSSLYYNLDNEDKEFASEVYAGMKYYILRSNDGDAKQILIPIGGELQLHIYHEKDGNYSLSLTPVSYIQESKELAFDLQISPYQDILDLSGNTLLANEFVNAYKGSVDFKRLRQGTRVVVTYEQKIRLGSQLTNPKITSAMVDSRGKKEYIFLYNKDRYYNQDGKEMEGFFLIVPLKYTRISSPFTLKRWHPILKKYRAHLGIDYAAPTGTKVNAAGDGRVTFVGTKNGYGKTITIAHDGNYMTLYAHLNGFKKGLKNGQRVKKGELIGYVGTTGVSSGPHLHLGLYKNNQAINPASVVKVTKNFINPKEKADFIKFTKKAKEVIEDAYETKKAPIKMKSFEYEADFNLGI